MFLKKMCFCFFFIFFHGPLFLVTSHRLTHSSTSAVHSLCYCPSYHSPRHDESSPPRTHHTVYRPQTVKELTLTSTQYYHPHTSTCIPISIKVTYTHLDYVLHEYWWYKWKLYLLEKHMDYPLFINMLAV